MKHALPLAAGLAAALLAAGCGSSSGGDYQACQKGIERIVASPDPSAQPPAACAHLSQAQVDEIAHRMASEHLRKVLQGSGPPAPVTTPGSVTQCTARIEQDAGNGTLTYTDSQAHDADLPAPCRPLSSDQLMKALDKAVKGLGA
jgi:hypothetical protein